MTSPQLGNVWPQIAVDESSQLRVESRLVKLARVPVLVARPKDYSGMSKSVTRPEAPRPGQTDADLHAAPSYELRGTIRHPATGDLMTVVKWEDHQEILEDREAMMAALNSAFLDRRTLATTPRNTIVRFTVSDSPVLVLEGRFVSHLETLCTNDKDGQPGTLEDLIIAIDECEERQRTDQAFMVTGLASPTGWDEEAIGYISSSGRGNTYRNRNVHIYLIDLGSEAVYFDDEDSVTASFAGLFRLATDQEDVSSLAEQLRAHLSDRNGVILADYARDLAVSEEMAIAAAYRLQESGNYRAVSYTHLTLPTSDLV